MLDPELVGYLDQRFAQIDQRFEQIDQRFERVEQEVRKVHVLFEDLDSQVQLVAESVAFFSDTLREFRVDVDRQFAEVKAVNRLSYVEIERRLATLGA
jgi:hypothetical protein